MYSLILTAGLMTAPAEPAGLFRAGCHGRAAVSTQSAGCAGTRSVAAVPRTGCHGSYTAFSRIREVTRNKVVGTAVAPVVVKPAAPPAPVVNPPKEVPKVAPVPMAGPAVVTYPERSFDFFAYRDRVSARVGGVFRVFRGCH